MSEQQLLARGLNDLGLSLDAGQQEKLIAYLDLLEKWNKAYNLTAVRDRSQMLARHLLDSLAVAPHVEDTPCLDVGTGGGLPGIPLAITYPERAFTLLDSNGKKARFVRQAVLELKLANVEVVHARVEQYRNAFPQVVSRAFASLQDMISLASHLVAENGRMLAMKAALSEQEMAAVPAGWQLQSIPLTVPQLNEPRELVVMTQSVIKQPGADKEKKS